MTVSLMRDRFERWVALPATVVLAQACGGGAPSLPPAGKPPEAVSNAVVKYDHDDGKSMEEMMAGKFPGVQVFRLASGGISVRIRGGGNSFYGSSEPLYIVDGTPVQSGGEGLTFLNPNDIAQIEVLKDAASTALYGVQGANGVVLITTKVARKP